MILTQVFHFDQNHMTIKPTGLMNNKSNMVIRVRWSSEEVGVGDGIGTPDCAEETAAEISASDQPEVDKVFLISSTEVPLVK